MSVFWQYYIQCVFYFFKYCDLSSMFWAVIGRSENGQPIGVTVHSYDSVSYVKGMGCNGLGKNTIFNEHSVPAVYVQGYPGKRGEALPPIYVQGYPGQCGEVLPPSNSCENN